MLVGLILRRNHKSLPNIKSLPTNVDVELGCDNNAVHSFHNVMLATPKGTAHTMFG